MKKQIFAGIFGIATVLMAGSAFAQDNSKVNGTGNIKTEDRNVSGSFKSIENSATFQVYVTQGTPASVRVEADGNLLPYILTDVSGSTLDLHTKKGYNLHSSDPMKVYVTLPEIEGLYTSGQGIFQGENHFKVGTLDISVSGEAKVDLDLDADNIKTSISGSGQIDLKGTSSKTSYSISGKGDVKAPDLQTGSCEMQISGMGNAEIDAKDHLDISISGMGNIKYKGNPTVNQHVSGMGKISSE
ncbi:MAG TPA: head GIN domain-containing protein [Chitinophagaceae bacterium]|nr:head GIN domain-containing protein [Chitinophagaceae bacterium]